MEEKLYPYEVILDPWTATMSMPPRTAWLTENFGVNGERWDIGRKPNTDNKKVIFYFKYEQDAVMFALRWAGVKP